MKATQRINLTGLADRAMREQIGAVCIHWSLVELMVERVIANLEGRPGIVTYDDDVTRRLRLLKQLARKHLSVDLADQIATIAGAVKELREDRHRIAHGLWGIDETNTIVSIYPWAKNEPRGKAIDAKEIREIKLRIWRVYQQLQPFADHGRSLALASRRKPG
jgi:hypothetical protein